MADCTKPLAESTLTSNQLLWHSAESSFTGSTHAEFKDYTLNNTDTSLMGKELSKQYKMLVFKPLFYFVNGNSYYISWLRILYIYGAFNQL